MNRQVWSTERRRREISSWREVGLHENIFECYIDNKSVEFHAEPVPVLHSLRLNFPMKQHGSQTFHLKLTKDVELVSASTSFLESSIDFSSWSEYFQAFQSCFRVDFENFPGSSRWKAFSSFLMKLNIFLVLIETWYEKIVFSMATKISSENIRLKKLATVLWLKLKK